MTAATPATAASAPRRVLAQTRFEALGLLRHGEQLLVSVVLPLLALVVLSRLPAPDLSVGRWEGVARIDVLTPGVLALAVLSTAFTGQAILLGFERRWGVLRLLGTTPLGRGGLLLAKVGAVLCVLVLQLGVLVVVGLALGWRPQAGGLLPAAVAVVLGALALVTLAVCLGGALRAEAVLALANLVWVLLAGVGGVLLPAAALPGEGVVSLLPSAALGDALRAAFVLGEWDGRALLLLALWGALGAVLARRLLRWSD
ncbi:ABC transporter permease [Serinicoccus kebangsaanensis]|uniref:ABC transporter permease n=1 Tax=Serinicoccus kebangsaanensis TaxID=2602069 RepID=UPI001EE23ADF|nr:ABC transporter permease [Serinicoccus kebangsaanensis]